MAKSNEIPYKSKSSLKQKLGYKVGIKVALWNVPKNYFQMIDNAIADCKVYNLDTEIEENSLDLIHIFGTNLEDIGEYFFRSIYLMKPKGGIWISWLKGTSKLKKELNSEITENTIREMVTPTGWKDIKVCSIDDNWSGLKFMMQKGN